MIRLEDKMNRIENIIKNGGTVEVEDEKLEDSVLDSAGYNILWLVEMHKKREQDFLEAQETNVSRPTPSDR